MVLEQTKRQTLKAQDGKEKIWKQDAAAAAKSLQSCPTLCDPIDGSPPGSPILGILQARTLEWVAISFSNAWKWKVKLKLLSHVRFLATPWIAAYQAPLSMGFSRQEYWSGVPLPSPKGKMRWCQFNSEQSFWSSTSDQIPGLRSLTKSEILLRICFDAKQQQVLHGRRCYHNTPKWQLSRNRGGRRCRSIPRSQGVLVPGGAHLCGSPKGANRMC